MFHHITKSIVDGGLVVPAASVVDLPAKPVEDVLVETDG
jgi:hypothetical protein